MADGGTFPHVVHRPDNRFAGGDDLLNIVQRQHALIDPMQVNDICLFENRKPGDIEPRIGNGYPKKILPAEKIICPNNETFPDKRELSLPRLTDGMYFIGVARFVQYQHPGVYSGTVERFHQTVCCDSRTAHSFGSIDD